MVSITWRPFNERDFEFFEQIISESGKWRKYELKDKVLQKYFKEYEEYPGEWRLWELDGERVGVSYHIESAPSNQKPWLGTILVNAKNRRQGFARAMIDELSLSLFEKGYKAIFAAVPLEEYEWANFLNDCGFEQFKTEENGGETFLVMVRPLE